MAVLNLVALVLHFCIDKFVVNRLPWDHAYIRDLVSFVIISITILVVAIPEGLPVAVMVSLAYSVKVRFLPGRRYLSNMAGLGLRLQLELEAIQRWSGDVSRVTLNFDPSKIPFVHF